MNRLVKMIQILEREYQDELDKIKNQMREIPINQYPEFEFQSKIRIIGLLESHSEILKCMRTRLNQQIQRYEKQKKG
jgi:hypothetical protein